MQTMQSVSANRYSINNAINQTSEAPIGKSSWKQTAVTINTGVNTFFRSLDPRFIPETKKQPAITTMPSLTPKSPGEAIMNGALFVCRMVMPADISGIASLLLQTYPVHNPKSSLPVACEQPWKQTVLAAGKSTKPSEEEKLPTASEQKPATCAILVKSPSWGHTPWAGKLLAGGILLICQQTAKGQSYYRYLQMGNQYKYLAHFTAKTACFYPQYTELFCQKFCANTSGMNETNGFHPSVGMERCQGGLEALNSLHLFDENLARTTYGCHSGTFRNNYVVLVTNRDNCLTNYLEGECTKAIEAINNPTTSITIKRQLQQGNLCKFCNAAVDENMRCDGPNVYPPTTPANATTPTDPATTALATTPTDPATTALATTPTDPATTALATTPTDPATTALATTPTDPATTATATTPTDPATTATATTPTDPATTALATTPTDPATTATATTPTDPATTATATTPTDPATTAIATTPTDPATTAIATTPTDPATTAIATTPTDPATTATATTPTDPATTAIATMPTDPATTAIATTPTDPATTVTTTTPTDPATTATATTPTDPATTATATTPTDPATTATATTPTAPATTATATTPTTPATTATATTPTTPATTTAPTTELVRSKTNTAITQLTVGKSNNTSIPEDGVYGGNMTTIAEEGSMGPEVIVPCALLAVCAGGVLLYAGYRWYQGYNRDELRGTELLMCPLTGTAAAFAGKRDRPVRETLDPGSLDPEEAQPLSIETET